MTSNNKNLNLDRQSLEDNIETFIKGSKLVKNKLARIGTGNVLRAEYGVPGSEPAKVDFYLNKDGSTSMQAVGKNPDLGQALIDYMHSTLNADEPANLESKIINVSDDCFSQIISAFREAKCGNGDNLFEVTQHPEAFGSHFKVTSINYGDVLTMKHFNTLCLQLQGKPLSSYKAFTYFAIDILDIWGLENILYKRDSSESVVGIVRKEVAEGSLRKQMASSYDSLPAKIQDLLLSGHCICLASPDLTDYSLLVYPALRALEGSLLDCFKAYGIFASNFQGGALGSLYKYTNTGYIVQDSHKNGINNPALIDALEDGYNIYHAWRHPLFHMDEEVSTSKMIKSLCQAADYCSDIRDSIDTLYKLRP